MKECTYRNYLLGVLLLILATNYMDQLTLGLVLQSIKLDLDLSDTQLGFLSGIAFALFYSVAGLPIARWADRGDRVVIISVTALLWSLMVIACGLTRTFIQLVLVRVGVAVGEAGCIPPAHSLIADSFARAERPRAVGVYLLGNSLSIAVGYAFAGWVNQLYGWRTTFILLGLLGLAPAALAWLTLHEPRRSFSRMARRGASVSRDLMPPGGEVGATRQPGAREVCATLWSNATFRHLLFGFSVVYFFSTGISQWQPAFFIRSYGLETGELGTRLAVIYGAGGFAGTLLGGVLSSRYAANNERLQLCAMAIAYCCYGLLCTLVYVVSSQHIAFVFMTLAAVLGAATSAPLFATIQTLVPPRLRAISIALVYLFANFIGLGLGPLATGVLSDLLRPAFGEESLRYALLALCPGYVWVAWHLWRASRTVASDLESNAGLT